MAGIRPDRVTLDGQTVQMARLAARLTQTEVARRMREAGHPISQTELSSIERGARRTIARTAVEPLASMLGVDSSAIIDDNRLLPAPRAAGVRRRPPPDKSLEHRMRARGLVSLNGPALRAAREKANMTQAMLHAAALEHVRNHGNADVRLSLPMISRMETFSRFASPVMLDAFAAVLGVDRSELERSAACVDGDPERSVQVAAEQAQTSSPRVAGDTPDRVKALGDLMEAICSKHAQRAGVMMAGAFADLLDHADGGRDEWAASLVMVRDVINAILKRGGVS